MNNEVENKKFSWDFDMLKFFYNTWVLKWINEAQSWTEAKKKQGRANLGFGNGDIDTVPTKDSNNAAKSGGIWAVIDQLKTFVTEGFNYYKPLIINGNIVNAPDEEDLTETRTHVMKLKDRAYLPLEFSGMGRVILRKNVSPNATSYDFDGFVNNVKLSEEALLQEPDGIYFDNTRKVFIAEKDGVNYLVWGDVNTNPYVPVQSGVVYMYNYQPYRWNGTTLAISSADQPTLKNVLTQDMFYKDGPNNTRVPNTNTVFVIQHDFELIEDITVPANCVLEFDGGSINGAYTLTGNNTCIDSGLVKIFGSDIMLDGSWNEAEAYPEWFGAKGDNETDCTLAIQKTIDFFSICRFSVGKYRVSSNISVSGNIYGEYRNTYIVPTFDGDIFRIVSSETSIIGLYIEGGSWNGPYNQPRTGIIGSVFVVGYNGANAQNCRIQDCVVYVYYGNGITWEHGSKLLLDNVTINKATGDGLICTSNYVDNNEGTFLNTHIMNCLGTGYNIVGGSDINDINNSRCHHFVNTKGFGNNKNYYINSIGNNGTVMSELGSTPDEFGPGASGNYICIYATATKRSSWIDNGALNTLSGYDSWATWKDSKRFVEALYINKRYTGYQILRQSGNNTFEDIIEGAQNQNVVITHSKGDARNRTDQFEGLSSVGHVDKFEVADSGWYSPFRPAGSNRDAGPHPFKVVNTKEEQTRFVNGFEVCPESFSGNPSWCIGSKDEIPLRCFIGDAEIWSGTKSDGLSVLVNGQKASPAILLSGTKANAPTVSIVGFMYFCTDITPARPIYWSGSAWVDATGATV